MSEPEVQSPVGDNRGPALGAREFNIIRRQAARGYLVPDTERSKAVGCCVECINDPRRPWRTRLAAIRTLATLTGQDQHDLHHVERLRAEQGILNLKMARAEEGKPNDLVAVQVVPVRELPLPPALLGYRKRLLEPSES